MLCPEHKSTALLLHHPDLFLRYADSFYSCREINKRAETQDMLWTYKDMQGVSLRTEAVTRQLTRFKYIDLSLKTHWSYVSHNRDSNTEISSC